MIVLLTLLFSQGHGAVTVEPTPRSGSESTITVLDEISRPMAGETVRITYRPGLAGEQDIVAGITDSLGRVQWTPERGGVAIIDAAKEQHTVTAAWRIWPMDTLVHLLLCVLGALAALAWSSKKIQIIVRGIHS